MAISNVPGVQINEVMLDPPPIIGVGTSTAGFIGLAPQPNHYVLQAIKITGAEQFTALYVNKDASASDQTKEVSAPVSSPLSRAVYGFFQNGGTACYVVNVGTPPSGKTVSDLVVANLPILAGLHDVSIIAAPGMANAAVYQKLIDQAEALQDRFAILDPPLTTDVTLQQYFPNTTKLTTKPAAGGVRPNDSEYAAFYYPQIRVGPDLPDDPTTIVPVTPVGHIAGVYARVDSTRGVHKAPANEKIRGALGVDQAVSDNDQNVLNPKGVNVLRMFPEGVVIWGGRTLKDDLYRYINVRRLVTYIELSLQEGLRWAVFEPNNLALRQKITRTVRGFLDGVWRDGALFGATADEAYYVRFPFNGNSDEDRAQGKLTVEIGLRATQPAEFIIINIGVLIQAANANA
jgi:phage tail sheath protein FI